MDETAKLGCESCRRPFETLSHLLITQTGCVVLITGIGQEVDKDGFFFLSLHDQRRTFESVLPVKDVQPVEHIQRHRNMHRKTKKCVNCHPAVWAHTQRSGATDEQVHAGLQSPPDGATHEAAEAVRPGLCKHRHPRFKERGLIWKEQLNPAEPLSKENTDSIISILSNGPVHTRKWRKLMWT